MISIRNANQRGNINHGWLFARHTFSFASYFDRNHMGFRSLRVINEDTIQPKGGFGTHPHDNMEILTYVLQGTLAHQDSMGNIETIGPGEFQIMSAGTGITHSEFNHETAAPTHLYQIWIKPNQRNVQPRYDQRRFDLGTEAMRLIAAPESRDGAMLIHADADIFLGRLAGGQQAEYAPKPNHGVWLQVTQGELTLNGQPMAAGDGAAIEETTSLTLASATSGEFLLFDLA